MDDLGILTRDFGFGPGAEPRSAKFSDVFGEPAKFIPNTNYSTNYEHSSMRDFEYDYISNEEANSVTSGSSKTSSAPVYDKPVYDDDIFEGLPGLKSKSAGILPPRSSKGGNHDDNFDVLLGNLRQREKATENTMSSSSSKSFDHLSAGFGSGISTASNRPITESNLSSVPVGGSKYGSVLDESFVVLESVLSQGSSSYGFFRDPMEDISKHGKSRSVGAEASSGGRRGYGDSDPLDCFEKHAHSFPLRRDKGGKERSTSRSASPQFVAMGEQKGSSSFRYSGSNMVKKTPLDDFPEPPVYDMPKFSTNVRTSFDQTTPQYFEASSQVDMSSTSSELKQQSDDVWLTVSEIPLFTQPTAAPPPSRPPPPIPHQHSRVETVFSSSSSRKKGDKFPSPSNPSQHLLPRNPKLSRPVTKGQFDELEDLSLGRSENSLDESANLHSSEDQNAFSASAAAAASAAAMKKAMEKAEAKFRHAKEVREREYAKTGRYKEPVQLEKDEQDGQEKYLRETGEILERERKQKEEEEQEQSRLQRDRERSREIERENARKAVERANREARERAAAQAHEKAATEARLWSERAAVEKANAEARERAGRVAVQRAHAEARERAAAEARDRATTAETKENKPGDRDFAARAEVEAKRRAERGAVERATAEARERAAAEARERAAVATAAKVNQQRNGDDLESFFSMGRASSAPKARVDSTNPFFNQHFQNKGRSEPGSRTPSSRGASSNMKKASSTTNIVDDLSSFFGASTAGEVEEVEGETEERRRARLVREQRTQERAAIALAKKNQRDLQAQREQEERHRFAENFDIEIKRWAAGKEGNLRALLSTLQYVLWPECGWQPVSLIDLINGVSVKKVYRKATLCIHPDKVQQKGATLQQKYIAEKVFDLLKEAWNKFNSEELF